MGFYQREKNKVNREVRVQSAFLKVKLLAYGVRDSPDLFNNQKSFKEEHYAYDNGNWGVDKGRLIPSEILLPGGIVSKIHIRPESPLVLSSNEDGLVITENGHILSHCETLKRPNFWNYETTSGVSTKKLAHFYGATCINFNPPFRQGSNSPTLGS